MSRMSFQLGTEIEQKSNVLLWRLPKRQPADTHTVSEQDNLKKTAPPFGRRIVPPVN